MYTVDLKQWRLQKGWTLKTAAQQFGLSVSKLRKMEEADKLSDQDKRLCTVLIIGIAAISLYEDNIERNKMIVRELNSE